MTTLRVHYLHFSISFNDSNIQILAFNIYLFTLVSALYIYIYIYIYIYVCVCVCVCVCVFCVSNVTVWNKSINKALNVMIWWRLWKSKIDKRNITEEVFITIICLNFSHTGRWSINFSNHKIIKYSTDNKYNMWHR